MNTCENAERSEISQGYPAKSLLPRSFILAFLYACFLGCWAWSARQLPEYVATHFNARGEPNGWMSRSANQMFMLLFGLCFPLLIVLLSYAARFMPSALVNIPHRDYWLAPERRRETCDYLVRHSLWLACLAVCFVIGIQFSIVRASNQNPPHLSMPMILAVVGLFLAGAGICVMVLMRHFRRAPFSPLPSP
jgi:uncharacterized membrane protein